LRAGGHGHGEQFGGNIDGVFCDELNGQGHECDLLRGTGGEERGQKRSAKARIKKPYDRSP
jgi:hypothetical protein